MPENIKEVHTDNIIVNVKDLNFYYGNYHLLKSVNLYFKKIPYVRF
jgi:phosphate ABC transporter ATP-binding protein, PhoT family (TC 3.A.1.7.1)